MNLKTHKADPPRWTQASSTSEATSVDLELSFLARASGEVVFVGVSLLKDAVLSCGRVLGMARRMCLLHKTMRPAAIIARAGSSAGFLSGFQHPSHLISPHWKDALSPWNW